MSKRNIILLSAVFLGAVLVSPQQPGDAKSSFDEFRKGLLNDYNSFRDGILADYAKFLDGVWVEYNGFRGEDRDVTPKPPLPVAAVPADTVPVLLPRPQLIPQVEPVNEPEPVPAPKAEPTPADAPPFTFDYRGIELQIPQVDVRLMERVAAPADFAAQWRALDANAEAAALVNEISRLAAKLNFNGYLTYDLAMAYAAARFTNASASSRTSLVHYVMTHLGYDARLGVNSKGHALIMFPAKQTIYGHMYFRFGNEKYYVFTDPSIRLTDGDMRVSTCELPAAASKAAKLDLRLGQLNIPYEAHPFSVRCNGLEIHGQTNAKLYPILYKYPQMPIGDYAESNLMPELRADLVQQLKSQLADKPRAEAVNTLLQFVQNGFEYATDHDYHGFEKPYFFEEIGRAHV